MEVSSSGNEVVGFRPYYVGRNAECRGTAFWFGLRGNGESSSQVSLPLGNDVFPHGRRTVRGYNAWPVGTRPSGFAGELVSGHVGRVRLR